VYSAVNRTISSSNGTHSEFVAIKIGWRFLIGQILNLAVLVADNESNWILGEDMFGNGAACCSLSCQ